MSDTEETELSKEERLELAKKKFEELKKKNKKKNKKLKKLKKDDADEKELELEEDEDEKVDEALSKEEETGETETLVSEEKLTTDEPVEEEKLDTVELTPVESSDTPAESAELSTEEPEENTSSPITSIKEEKVQTWLDEIQEPVPELDVPESTTESKIPVSDSTPLSTDVDSSVDIIQRQLKEITLLKEEITDLRMNKFELLDKIESLESTIKRLNNKLNSKKIDQPLYQSDYNSELSLSPVPTQQTPTFIKTPSFQNFGNNYTESSGDLRDRLLRWKDWQLDMRSWRSKAGGPIIEI